MEREARVWAGGTGASEQVRCYGACENYPSPASRGPVRLFLHGLHDCHGCMVGRLGGWRPEPLLRRDRPSPAQSISPRCHHHPSRSLPFSLLSVKTLLPFVNWVHFLLPHLLPGSCVKTIRTVSPSSHVSLLSYLPW